MPAARGRSVWLVACELRLASFCTGLGPKIHCSGSTPYNEIHQAVPIYLLDVAWRDVHLWHKANMLNAPTNVRYRG